MKTQKERSTVNFEYMSMDASTFTKTVLMIIVVLYHSMALWTNEWSIGKPVIQSAVISYVALWFNSFHIYGFVVISGYIFFCLKHEKGKYEVFSHFVTQKARRLLVPVIFVSIIWAIPFGIAMLNYDKGKIISNYILGISPNQLWFLWMLFWVFMISWVLFDFIKTHTILSGLLVIVLYGLGIFGSSLLPNFFQIWTACQFVVYFWIGIKFRQFGTRYFSIGIIWGALLIQICLYSVDYFWFQDTHGISK